MQAIKLKLALAICLASGFTVSLPALSQPTANQSVQQQQHNSVAELHQRLLPFLNHADVWTQYHAQKAQMWLTYAANQHSEGGWTAAEQQAQAQATQLIEQLEQQQPISTTTPIIQSSKVMRRDLWVNAELLKQQAGFDCASTEVAQAEVMLVWAAAEHCELGWRHSRELFAAAERLIDKANNEVASCHGAAQSGANLSLPAWNSTHYPSLEQLNGTQKGCHGVIGSWPLVSATAIPAVQPVSSLDMPVVAMPRTEPVTQDVIPNVVHFALDQASLSASSQQVLRHIAEVLAKNPSYSLTLYGHTDARGRQAYNLALSQRRAKAVEQFLVTQGVAPSRIATMAAGEQHVIADPVAIQAHALSRRVILVYSSAEGDEMKTIAQTRDLQPEQ